MGKGSLFIVWFGVSWVSTEGKKMTHDPLLKSYTKIYSWETTNIADNNVSILKIIRTYIFVTLEKAKVS